MKSIKNRSKINTCFRFILIGIIFAISFADPPNWTDNPGDYEFIATISGGIVLSNGEQMGNQNDGDIFAAFDTDGNVRGVAIALFPPFGPHEGTCVFEMQLRSSEAEGDLLSFKYYDASEDALLDIAETYEFVINDILGDVTDPVYYNLGNITLSFTNTTTIGAEINYISNVDISGFQFDVSEVEITGVSGGDAASAGFTISNGNNTVLGFSFTGLSIAPGSGTLVNLEFVEINDVSFLKLSNIVISGPSGSEIQTSGPEYVIIGDNGTCSGGTILKHLYLGSSEDLCVPTEFSTAQSSQLAAYYYFWAVTINEAEVEADDWVGAFKGDICVGARKWDVSQCGGLCDLPVMGDDGGEYSDGYMLPGEFPEFRIYDNSLELYYLATAEPEYPWGNGSFFTDGVLTANVESVSGCTDPDACNYDPSATEDDGSCAELDDCGECGGDNYNCEDPESECICAGCMEDNACNYSVNALIEGSCVPPPTENYDCAANCCTDAPNTGSATETADICPDAIIVDCLGVCGGTSVVDECGICNGIDGYESGTCNDCFGIANGQNIESDNCGCIGPDAGNEGNPTYCNDCNGVPDGDAEEDECGVCDGNNSSCSDCADVPNGSNVEDNCGICDSDNSNDCIQDCNGAWGGPDSVSETGDEAAYDECGVCGGDNSSCTDCLPSFNPCGDGTQNCDEWAYYDNCGICDSDPSTDCSNDCHGTSGGDAVLDNCGICDVDTSNDCTQGCDGIWGSGKVYDSCISEQNPNGICDGGSSSCQDCAGVPNGNNVVDNCGTCDNDLGNDCVQGCDGVWGSGLVDDECGVCGGVSSSCTDCNDVINGDAYLDFCDNCVGGNTGEIACISDCTGTWGGTAEEDECDVCDGQGPLGPDEEPNVNYDCAGMCISEVDCNSICGGGVTPSFNCLNGNLVCYPAECNSLDIATHLMPDQYGISRIFPNPFNPITQVQYEIFQYGQVIMRVYDIRGREITQLLNIHQNPGHYAISWNAENHASGMYFIEMVVRSGEQNPVFRVVKKVLYLK